MHTQKDVSLHVNGRPKHVLIVGQLLIQPISNYFVNEDSYNYVGIWVEKISDGG